MYVIKCFYFSFVYHPRQQNTLTRLVWLQTAISGLSTFKKNKYLTCKTSKVEIHFFSKHLNVLVHWICIYKLTRNMFCTSVNCWSYDIIHFGGFVLTVKHCFELLFIYCFICMSISVLTYKPYSVSIVFERGGIPQWTGVGYCYKNACLHQEYFYPNYFE